MAAKYEIEKDVPQSDVWLLKKEGKIIAKFLNDPPNNRTNAQKVCDLLNETSRSHGKYP